MATKKTSQPQHGVEQLDSIFNAYTKCESRGVKFAAEAIDESARLAKDFVIYAGEISAEARKIALEGVRRYAEAWERTAPAAPAAKAPKA
jgi:hypothetical protein